MGRGWRGIFAGVLAASWLALPGPAQATLLEAETVLPPGQSGFVSIPGVTDGTGSPHLTDQVGLFNAFSFKPASFDQPGREESPMPGVRIVRDRWGVPEVHAGSEAEAWRGVGYAVAQDRLFQLELFKRATSGRLAEILGRDFLEDDIVVRRDFYTGAEVDAMIERSIPADLRALSEAYVQGINDWIAEVRSDPSKLPGEFAALGVPLTDWTMRDTARVGIFLARTVPSGDGLELDNARALQGIGARAFTKLLPLRDRGRRPSVPPGRTAREHRRSKFPSQPGRTRRHEVAAFRRSVEFVRGLDLPAAEVPDVRDRHAAQSPDGDGSTASASARSAHERLSFLPQLGRRGSFMWAIRDRERHRTYFYNGPQLGFSIPELFIEFRVRAPGLNLHLSTAPGVPLVGIGHNGQVAWGFTSGLSDEDDLYVEELTGEETYRFRGAERQMSCRDEQIDYNAPPPDLPGVLGDLDPEAASGSHTERVCRTVHGPVQERHAGQAFARRYAIWGRELETLVGLRKMTLARDVRDVDRALQEVTWNENIIAADERGNIGFWHPGLHPLRPRLWDERLPYPGTGEAEWRGLLPRSRTPRIINPRQGWLANWNNVPSWGWTSGDLPARERGAGPWHRVRWVEALVRRAAREPTYERSRDIVRASGTIAQQRPFAGRVLREAYPEARGDARQVLRELWRWDGSYNRRNGHGTVDPGVAIWVDFKDRAEAILLARLGAEAAFLAGATSRSHQFDISNGEATALTRLSGRDLARAAAATAAALERRFGTPQIHRWREPRRMYELDAMGAGSAPDLPFFDRGTWEMSVALGRR